MKRKANQSFIVSKTLHDTVHNLDFIVKSTADDPEPAPEWWDDMLKLKDELTAFAERVQS